MRTRTAHRSRLVPHTVDGQTEMILDHYTVQVPLPPRDWDQTVRTAVTLAAGLLVTISVCWSVVSIGQLLSLVAAAAAAYGAAAAFDLLWIMCTAVEWLCRHDPRRARFARWAGRVALAVAMAAIFAHGYLAGQPVVGAAGAVVSALAKAGTSLALAVHARPLDAPTQQWIAKRRAALDGQLAMIPVRRELLRGQALIDAERAALQDGPDRGPDPDPDIRTGPDRSADRSGSVETGPDEPDVLPSLDGPRNVKQAVRTAVDSGITDPDAVLRYVRKVADDGANPESVRRYLRTVRKGA